MRQWICAMMGCVVLSGTAAAQGRYAGDLPVEVEWGFTRAGDLANLVTVKMRNIAGLTPGGFWAFGALRLRLQSPVEMECIGWFPGRCGIGSPLSPRVVGSVDRRDIGTTDRFNISAWQLQMSGSGPIFEHGPWSAGTSGLQSLGIIGCQLPEQLYLPHAPDIPRFGVGHTGRTCADDGFDGWIEYEFYAMFGTRAGAEAMTVDHLTVTPKAQFIANIAVVPERPLW